jgi:hypothetical protein
MRADIHYGREQQAPLKGRIQMSETRYLQIGSYPACNTRPVHTDVPTGDITRQSPYAPQYPFTRMPSVRFESRSGTDALEWRAHND